MTTPDVRLVWTMTTRTMNAQRESTTCETGLIRKMTTGAFMKLNDLDHAGTSTTLKDDHSQTRIVLIEDDRADVHVFDDDVQRARTGERLRRLG